MENIPMAKKAAKPANVPKEDTMALALQACEFITEGHGVRLACKQVGMDQGKFFRLLAKEGSDELAKRYARARQARADARVESMDDILDLVRVGAMEPSAARVILDNIKWVSARENQSRYGERLDLNHKGDPNAPIQITREIIHRTK